MLQVISVDGSKSLETIVFALGVLPIAMVAIANYICQNFGENLFEPPYYFLGKLHQSHLRFHEMILPLKLWMK